MSDGWDESAEAWLADMGERGDYAREYILDAPMLAAVRQHLAEGGTATALDVGCGEGRFCRMMAAEGIAAVGLDPTEALLEAARARDPAGEYVVGRGEALPFDDDRFGLTVAYVSLIDMAEAGQAIAEMARVTAPGGHVLACNMASFVTAFPDGIENIPWIRDADGGLKYLAMDRYLEARSAFVAWRGIRIKNYHRPMNQYMGWFLQAGLVLRSFEEPAPTGGSAARQEAYGRVPFFWVMLWQKPARPDG